MTDRQNDRDLLEAPETVNMEQSDDGQAQDVAADALLRGTGLAEDSEHGGQTNPAQILPDDVQDVVDHMNAMDASGRIDNGAYAGEPMMDDEEGELGQTDSDEDPI